MKGIEEKAKEWAKTHPLATLEEAFEAGHKYKPTKITLTDEMKRQKELEFAESLKPYVSQYGQELIMRFYTYWSQWDGTKMLWQKQSAFEIKKRLVTFSRNNYGNRNTTKQTTACPSIFERANAVLSTMQQGSESF